MDPNSPDLQPGERVRIVGPDHAGDYDDLGMEGEVGRYRGGGDYWVYLPSPHPGAGTWFPRESLERIDQ